MGAGSKKSQTESPAHLILVNWLCILPFGASPRMVRGAPYSLISGWYPRGDSLSILLNDMGVDRSYFKRTLRQSQNMVG